MSTSSFTIPTSIQATADAIMASSRSRFGHNVLQMMARPPVMMPSDVDLDEVRNEDHFRDRNDRAVRALELRDQANGVMAMIANGAKDPSELSASASRRYAKAEELVEELQNIHAENYVDRSMVVPKAHDEVRDYRAGHPLAAGQTFRGAVNALDLDRVDARRFPDQDPAEMSFTTVVRNALSGGSGAAGGFVLPTVLTADLVDLARNKSRVLEAGARVVPMANRTVDVPKWASDPVPSWRLENAPIVESDATLGKLTLSAHTLACHVRVSRELIEDTMLEDDLRAAFAAGFALAVDAAALYSDGSGAGDTAKPRGVKATPGVTVTPVGANGAPITYDDLVESVGRLRDVNEEPNAQILSDRSARNLGKLKNTQGDPITPSPYLDGVTRYSSNQVPNNLAVGTSGTTTSDVFTADWSQLYVGVRTSLQISLLSERFMVDAGQYAFVAWWRGDVQVARPKAFDVISGVKVNA